MASSIAAFESRQALPSTSNSPALDVRGHTLILPCVSIGNVGQLAVDILLASTLSTGEKAEYFCDLDARYCVPFVGASTEANHPSLRTPLQVFTFPKSKLTIIQQRSPILKTHKDQFVANLGKWAQEKGFSEIICLAGIDAGLRTDTQMQHPFWHLTSSSSQSVSSSPLSASFAKLLPVYTRANTHAIHELTRNTGGNDDSIPPMPAGGLVRKLLKAAKKEPNWLPTTALLVFAAEGDNRADAMAMAKLIVNTSQDNKNSQLSQPSDWNLLFGPPLEPGMF
ncbi:uncharacterized protein FA14DRAFT_161990 [Meira miltonrushii]|uniref:Proteasome assembly chaperone 2 n=1 Tax=Meira miltonrushii TaxID=1280837 RepID=A0A316V5Y0_9BASI|nr:uncharacterized protein FA14DRAFT_161990 [Meira miltonrushii]PWN32644.1 hypothetical protein FA14DRAFT_161990 [Meira miltonrushii]